MTPFLLAVLAGVVVGLSLGATGGGGSVLAVPVLVYLLDQPAGQATTGSLVVVGVTSLLGAATAYRAGNARLGRGLTFGVVSVGGAATGARAAAGVSDAVLLASFSVLMLVVGGLMVARQVRGAPVGGGAGAVASEPPVTLSPFRVHPRSAVLVLVSATVVGLLTGFLGVGGGFLVVPVLLLVLGMSMEEAAGTSLVAITLTSAAALAFRVGSGTTPGWPLVLTLTAASALAGVAGARLADRVGGDLLAKAFTGLVVVVAVYTAARALPGLF